MRDIVKWLEEWIMCGISMKALREAELNPILNGRGCHIIEVILWTFLAQSAVLTAEDLQQSGGRKAACKAHQRFTFVMRVGAQRTTWHSCTSPGPVNFMMLQTHLVGSRALSQTEGAFPLNKLEAGQRGRWRRLWWLSLGAYFHRFNLFHQEAASHEVSISNLLHGYRV